jgi:protein involved in polysaccharide export with SLBB domain
MYKYFKNFSHIFLLQILIGVLVFQLSIPAFAQSQRRGVYLQDQYPSEGAGSFQERANEDELLRGQGVDDEYDPRRMRSLPSEMATGGQGLIYQVHVLGEVKKPGTYRVTPSMRVTDALNRAGSIKQNGSERFIELRKPGQAQGRVLDLFAYKTFGDLNQNPYLRDNDTIYVPLKKMAVEIEGPVRRPGIFELKEEKNLSDIVQLAGGFTVGVSEQNPIKVVRFGGYEEKEILDIPINSNDMKTFQVQDGDVIVIPHKFLTQHEFDYNIRKLPNDNIFYPSYENRVFVIGAVRQPGAFDFNQYYSLRQYLTLAGGTTNMAKNGKIKVVNVEGKTFKAKNGNYDRNVNPGDTIVVPEKSVPITFYLSLLPTIASLGLSGAALFK